MAPWRHGNPKFRLGLVLDSVITYKATWKAITSSIKQSNFQQYILLFYKPFEDKNGEFAGVAYAFVNLYEEYLANDTFASAIDEGICKIPPRNCTTGE